MPYNRRTAANRILLAATLVALAAATIAPALDRARSPNVVTTPASVAVRVDAAVVAVASIHADGIVPASSGGHAIVQTVVPLPVRHLPPHAAPAAVDLVVCAGAVA
jgi:hypothetical protein